MTKRSRSVFVIMPFTRTATRDKTALDNFYEYCLKRPLEECDTLKYNYRVSRSDTSFDITAKIIQDLYDADIVLCDLSGEHANPNVMYELGVRLAITNKPVIMFRERHNENKKIFDISHYHTEEYAHENFSPLERYILTKIARFETGEEVFRSPVLAILGKNPAIIATIEKDRLIARLKGLLTSLTAMLRATGGSILMHLQAQNATPLPSEDISELPNYLIGHKAMLGKIDWKDHRFRPRVPPQLYSILNEYLLGEVCEEWIAELWWMLFNEYYGRFFSTDLYWSNADFTSMIAFVCETHTLLAGTDGLIDVITATNAAESREALRSMLDPLRSMAGLPDDIRATVIRRFKEEFPETA